MKDVLKYSVGIDVGSKELHVCVGLLNASQAFKVKAQKRFVNSAKGIAAFWEWLCHHLSQGIRVVYVMEATGVYHELVCDFLYQKGSHVSVIVPSQSKAYARSLGVHTKTDKVDSRTLSQMGAERNLSAWQAFSPKLRELRNLTRQHENLQVLKNQVESQIHACDAGAYATELVQAQHKKMLEVIVEQIEELEVRIKKLVQEAEELNKKWQYIEPIYGVGILTFAIVVAETNGFALFSNERQLTKFAGYDVVENQSGKHVGKTKISKKGNAHLRRILHMASLTAVKDKDSPFAKLYQRVFDRTQIKMKGYIAAQRKLLTIIFHLWKKEVAYDKNYRHKLSSILEQNDPLSLPNASINP